MYFRGVLTVLFSLFFIITSGADVMVAHMPSPSAAAGGCCTSVDLDSLVMPARVTRSVSYGAPSRGGYTVLAPHDIDPSCIPPEHRELTRSKSSPSFGSGSRIIPPTPLGFLPLRWMERDSLKTPKSILTKSAGAGIAEEHILVEGSAKAIPIICDAEVPPKTIVEVTDVGSVEAYVALEGVGTRGLVIFDADDVMFTKSINPVTGEEKVIRLYEDLEGLIARLKEKGHTVIVLTYNKKAHILDQMAKVGLSEALFDAFVSCNKEGDPYSAKGKAFKEFMRDERAARLLTAKGLPKFDFAVFIDNFDGFCRDMEDAGRELELKLTALHYTAYLEHYYRYIYHFLKQLQQDLEDLTSTEEALAYRAKAEERKGVIFQSLFKYEISLGEFQRVFPGFEIFREYMRTRTFTDAGHEARLETFRGNFPDYTAFKYWVTSPFAWPDLLHR